LIPAWRIPGSVLFAEPASRFCGFAYGNISTSKADPVANRLEQIYAKTCQVLADEKPDLMVLEDVFSLEKYPKSGIVLGKVCGVLLLAGTQSGVPADRGAGAPGQTDPHRKRKGVQGATGAGGAHAPSCAKAPIRPFHASDALGLALIGLFPHNQAI
jgi:crossover junction endodeoxyribonuclease RuvC